MSLLPMMGIVVGVVVVAYAGIAVFERVAPRRAVRAYQRFANRLQRPLLGVGPGWVVIETVGRRTGLPRQVPVGARVSGGSVWIVAGDGRRSAFVLNIEAQPRVRVRARGRWHTGTARLLPDDDPYRRLLRINPLNSLFVLVARPRSTMLTVRVDLDDVAGTRR